jgi:hypothetical protein
MDYSNLRTKTPLDFTSDKEILEELRLDTSDDLEYLPRISDKGRADLLWEYALVTEDDELMEAIKEQFTDTDFVPFFWE